MTVDRVLTRLFGRPEEINGADRCPTYLYRWPILPLRLSRALGNVNVYVHKFVGEDWARDLHDHPKRFVSIGLWGTYVEHTPGPVERGRWEVVEDTDGGMVRVRWSIPDAADRYLWVRHYPADAFGRQACARQAAAWNAERVPPERFEYGAPIEAPSLVSHRFRAPWVRSFPATHIHRITGPTPERPCWTLVIVLRTVRAWGFWSFGRFIPWRTYVDSTLADERKACQ